MFAAGTQMNGIVNHILAEVAEILPSLSPDEKDSLPKLPVDAPNFSNDLEPVIRAETPPPQQKAETVDRQCDGKPPQGEA
ncbi:MULTISPECIES: hypothetical protein [unclassified Mesorhizobium]|uniref:hypothetical protein n=1 Tax=unclassified Mesorhizobium TaxID=325217 RepID=UPI00333680A2